MIREVLRMGDPRLLQKALPVESFKSAELDSLLQDMRDTMAHLNGAGLAAPQIGVGLRVVIFGVSANPRYPGVEPIALTTLVNPRLTAVPSGGHGALADRDAITVYEGCLSVTGLRGRVRRPRRVRVEAWDRSGAPLDFTWEGFRAAVVQHEVDHLHGTLFVDRALPQSWIFTREYERFVPLDQRIVDGAQRTDDGAGL